MRKILFRGKSVNTGEWIESMTISYGTIKRKRDNIFMEVEPNKWKGVDPKTVGQFTGLTDKNGKEIFEGDIIKTHNQYGDEFIDIVIWNESTLQFEIEETKQTIWSELNLYKYRDCEIIGNIYDNPELLTK